MFIMLSMHGSYFGQLQMQIQVHPLTNNPTAAWQEISKCQTFYKIDQEIPLEPVADNMVRFVCMSDTHSQQHRITFTIPDGDVFLHAGDFTNFGRRSEVEEFNSWLGTLPHRHKVVICGNHELSFDSGFTQSFKIATANISPASTTIFKLFSKWYKKIGHYFNRMNGHSHHHTGLSSNSHKTRDTTENIHKCLTNCTYLEDESIQICGIKIYGTPWQPEYGPWAFCRPRGKYCLEKWNLIPEDTDVLITHGPPLGRGDLTIQPSSSTSNVNNYGLRAGCVELLNTVQQRVKPKYHVFGHIHEGYGVTSDGKIIFINASTCDINYGPRNEPIVFDMPLPEGKTK